MYVFANPVTLYKHIYRADVATGTNFVAFLLLYSTTTITMTIIIITMITIAATTPPIMAPLPLPPLSKIR